ncbi:eukaryotic translation initiation factor 5B-like [Forsythia ovata]|uniref:Eukaryotic translation initiation factor 5B-like n=1 Tax=Forsythia ovata TaxID=205694 RepID=A0ABD1UBA9_9LAMI
MSRCFQFPPPGCKMKETWREGLIERIKIQKEREKAKEEKRKRREEKQKRREKKKKTNQLSEKSCNVEKVYSVKNILVDTKDGHLCKERKDGSEQLEKGNLTEENGLPTCLCIPTSTSETESTENSSKRKMNSWSIDGDIIGLQLELKKQKKHYTLYNEEMTDILPQHKDEKFWPISEGTGNIGRGIPQTDAAINCSISKQIEATAQGKRGTQSSTVASMISLQKVASLYKNLFEDWVPVPLPTYVQPDPNDEDWHFQGKSQDIHSDKRIKSSSNSISISCSSSLWPRAQFFPEADRYALPFTVPL